MFDRKLLLATTTLAGILAFAPGVTFAQSPTDDPATTSEPPSSSTTADDTTVVDELVITGSRIRRTEFTSPSPVQIITSEGSTLEGLVDASEVLQTSTIAAGSSQINNTFTGFVVSGGPGVNTISLRGLGDVRTLVLMNGRRLPPAGVQGQVGAVDLNILPEAMIERYEILKDGASSIYGSDAVAGVVNIITKRDLDGGLISVDGTASEQGGGEEYSVSAAYGRVFDRGHFMVSGQWYRREPLLMGDRPWLDCAQPYTFDPDTGQRNDMIDFDTGDRKCISSSGNVVGYIPVNEALGFGTTLLGYTFYGSRVPIAVEGPRGNPDANLPGLRFIPLDERNFNPEGENDTTVISPVDRYTIYADGAFDLGFGELYGETLLHRRESSQKGYQTIFHIISEEAPCGVNPFNCPGGSTRIPGVSGGATPGLGFLTHLGFAPETRFLSPITQTQEIDVLRGLVGLRGDFVGAFLNGWTWDTYLSYSTSRGDYSITGLYNDRIEAVTGTDSGLNFLGVCPPGSFAGCEPVNFFTNEILLAGTLSPELFDMLQIRETGQTEYNQLIAEAQVTGDLFELPAGPIGAAFGVVFRRDELDDKPGPEAVAGNYWGLATAGPTKGDDSLSEIYGELEMPLVRGVRHMQELTLNVSGRYSEYDSYGGSPTYKVGVNWRLNNQVRLRSTYGTSFRAPALYEQFLNDQTAFLPQASVDPCIRWGESTNPTIRANCEAEGLPPNFAGAGSSAELLIGGGDSLEAEDSTSFSLGFIYTPEFIDLNLAIDYWEIEVENEVVSLAASVVGQCYASADFPNSEFCALFERDPDDEDARMITFIDASYRNITRQSTRGVDLTTRYTRDIGPGKLTWDAQATWTLEDELELFAGNVDDFNGVIGEPKFVAQSALKYEVQDSTFTWSSDFIARQSNIDYQFGTNCDLDGNYAFAGPGGFAPYCAKNWVEPVWYHHASFRYEWPTWDILLGMRNVFDERPPFATDALRDRGLFTYGRLGSTSGATQYDYVGRRFFVSVTKSF